MYEGNQNWRDKNATRDAIRHRELGVNIKGISMQLEDLSPEADVHGTRYVNRMDAADINTEVISRSAEDKDVASAKRVEDYHNSQAANLRKQKHAGVVAPHRRSLDDMAFFGAGVIRAGFKPWVRDKLFPNDKTLDKDELLGLAKKVFEDGFDEDPFMFECPQINTVAFEPDFSSVCEVGVRSVSQMLKVYDDLTFSDTNGFDWITSETVQEYQSEWRQQEVTYYHLETSDYIYDVIDSGPIDNDGSSGKEFMLRVIPNIIGRPWYTFTFAHINNNADYSKRYLPLINAIYPLVHNLNFLSTLLVSGALSTGRPMYQEVDISHSASTLPEILTQPVDQRPVLMFDPSEEILKKPSEGKRWDIVPVPDMSWVVETVNKLEHRIERFGFPVALSPEASTEGKAESGVQGMQQIETSVNYLDPALNNVALSLHELFQIVGDALTEMGVKVKVPIHRKGAKTKETLTVLPSDFRDHDLSVTLKSTPATAQMALRSADLELVQLKMMSKTRFFMNHYEDWQAELDRVVLDEGKALIENRFVALIDAFVKEQGDDILADAAADQNVPLPPLANQSGGPEDPGGARNNRPPVPSPIAGAPNIPVDQNPAQTAATAQQVTG